ncbi:FtsW/RodA/SpoVE family cell cycle protein [Microbispora sp. NPDC046973]|uniref:FtsW/RodA/SpoVE family cell cycle protein n=1 Tax=Microbispora sp. NPDC046973 TaxID=3155022 RepID=UPI0033FE7176
MGCPESTGWGPCSRGPPRRTAPSRLQGSCRFGVQAFVIVGVPLPLVSCGGSSVVACLVAVGVLMSVRRQDVRRL